jgi:hypothetical protein
VDDVCSVGYRFSAAISATASSALAIYMTWYAFTGDGHVYDLEGIANSSLVATGAHGYATEAEAIAHRNATPSALQASLLAGFVTDASSPVGGGLAGVIQVIDTSPSGAQTGTVSPVSNPLTSVAGDWVGGITKWLGQGNIWLRAAEIGVGIMLIYIGLKASVTPGGAAKAGKQTFSTTMKKAVEVFAK